MFYTKPYKYEIQATALPGWRLTADPQQMSSLAAQSKCLRVSLTANAFLGHHSKCLRGPLPGKYPRGQYAADVFAGRSPANVFAGCAQ